LAAVSRLIEQAGKVSPPSFTWPASSSQDRYTLFVTPFDEVRLGSFAAGEPSTEPNSMQLSVRVLKGGLTSSAVARVFARVRERAQPLRHRDFVVKRLSGPECREIEIYESLARLGVNLSPRFLGFAQVGPRDRYLYIEHINRQRSWPWKNALVAGLVLEELARLHASVSAEAAPLDWNYEADLAQSSESTLELLEYAARRERHEWARYGLRHVRLLARELPAIRDELLRENRAFIHGDVHPGNVRIRVMRGREQVVLLDWSRARIGSPLEDVSSWLQSLGFWEPHARQRHDTLLERYLITRGKSLSRGVRVLYWLAGASNALAGALRYHIWLATGSRQATPLQRARAISEARHWLRIVRRAAECWRNLEKPSISRCDAAQAQSA
jgi:hypothetical protein